MPVSKKYRFAVTGTWGRRYMRSLYGPVALLILLPFACPDGFCQPADLDPRSPALRGLAARLQQGDEQALDLFWQGVESNGTPVFEEIPGDTIHTLVTFVHRDSAASAVRLSSNLNVLLIEGVTADFERLGAMRRLADTDLWFLSLAVPNDVRAPYRFDVVYAAGDTTVQRSVTDPNNRRILWEGSPFALSVLELPDAAPQPWIEEKPSVEKGTWIDLTIPSRILAGDQPVSVYLPAGYDAGRTYEVLVGLQIVSFKLAMPTDRILDNLAAADRIPPTICVVTDIGGPEREQDHYASTVAFLADELLPALRARYALTADPARVTIAGTSRRGLVAAYAGLMRPDTFGNVITLSGSFYWKPPDFPEYEWLTRLYAYRDRAPLRLYVAAGRLETVVTPNNRGHYMLAANRHMRNVLQARGYAFQYMEFAGVHHELSWRNELANGLIYLRGWRNDRVGDPGD